VKRLRVAILVHEDLVPPDDLAALTDKQRKDFKAETSVSKALAALGHAQRFIGVSDDLAPIRQAVADWQPHIVFNLLMEFRDVGALQVNVASYLELIGVPYTGCNPPGILLTRDKALSKKILRYHRIPTPRQAVFPRGRPARMPAALRFPLIVKSQIEEASLGISQASLVRNEEKLAERAEFIHESIGTHAIAEEYVAGREITVSVLGNHRLMVFPPWELFFRNLPEGSVPIATERVKFDLAYQKRVGVDSGPADPMPEATRQRIAAIARRVYRAFSLSGYARIDLRLPEQGGPQVIEVNATPDVSDDEDLAFSAAAAGLAYPQLVQRILNLGLRYRAPWAPG
jgi:D-alanine-D-alanine ligase